MAIRSEEYVFKANEFVRLLAKQLEKPNDISYASQVTLSALNRLRDSLSPEESLQLIAQFPLYIKAAYVDGWHLDTQGNSTRNSRVEPNPREFRAFLSVVEGYVSQREMQYIFDRLPKDFQPEH
jgi:uncharacterized protein (DUF2267 family)